MAEPARPALGADADGAGAEMYALAARLYPLTRSITGNGVRETLRVVAAEASIPLQQVEVPSGTQVLDWIVPREWNLREAWIADGKGRRLVDAARSNLHVVSYSTPLRRTMTLEELRPHLHALPEHPDWIPYRTSYYDESWGFCLTQRQLDAMRDTTYEVCIDSILTPGSLTYGELVVPGARPEEMIISAHVCHPSLADDNVSGIVVAAYLARHFARNPPAVTLRFLFAPGTIGTITWLSQNPGQLDRILWGLTLVCLGDGAPFTYKRTIGGGAPIDRVMQRVLAARGGSDRVIDYFPYGYDERQYNAPGFRIPVGSLMRGRHGRFPEYHTSADDLGFISAAHLEESLRLLIAIVGAIGADRRYRSLAPFGEPQLGRRGLFRALGGSDIPDKEHAMLWVLSLSDGRHSVADIAERSGLAIDTITATAELLTRHGLLARA